MPHLMLQRGYSVRIIRVQQAWDMRQRLLMLQATWWLPVQNTPAVDLSHRRQPLLQQGVAVVVVQRAAGRAGRAV